MKLPDTQTVVEQIALLFTSFIWTVVVLAAIIIFWLYQDVQARWDFVLNAPPEALAQAAPPLPPTATPPPTPTLWPGPGPTLTPSPTKPPTPTATWVIPPPNVLPETLNPDDPTPVPVVIPTDVNIEGLEVEPAPSPVPPPTATPEPTQSPPQPEQEPIPLPFDTPTPIPEPTATVPAAPPPTAPPPNIPVTDEGIPDRLVIPSVGIDAPVISVGWRVVEQNNQQYSIWDVADYAVGWHKTSARLGQPGNSVMAGHHNINGEVFRDLVNVEVGDRVTVYTAGGLREYVVDLKTIVKEKGEPPEVRQRNAQWIASTTDERLTLVTCWPYTNNTHRVIVVAKPL